MKNKMIRVCGYIESHIIKYIIHMRGSDFKAIQH